MRTSRHSLVIVAVGRSIVIAARIQFLSSVGLCRVMTEEWAYAHARKCRGKTLDGDISVDMQI